LKNSTLISPIGGAALIEGFPKNIKILQFANTFSSALIMAILSYYSQNKS
jgi:hypothetical protein